MLVNTPQDAGYLTCTHLLLQHTEMSTSDESWSHMPVSTEAEKGHLLGFPKQTETLRENFRK